MANLYENRYIALGIIGALIILYGHTKHSPQLYYIIGSSALFFTALYYKLLYFIALELILVAGHAAVLIGIGPNTQLALPILLCLQLAVFYLMIGKENSIFLLVGIVGIALLSSGFAYNNQWIFFSGSFFIAIYAYYSALQGQSPSYIWAVLNTIFALIALDNIFF